MATLDRLIQRESNPFDAETFWSGNFWQEKQNPAFTVDSIHQEAIADVEDLLAQLSEDHRTRTLLLEGETGSGKTYLLGRIKRQLNAKAFFVYIEPFTASEYIWRHILRYTVDSLLQVPEGEEESQLILWLKGLSEFKHRSLWDMLRGDRQLFITNLRDRYPTGIYNAHEFFGVLYDLTNPKLSSLACEWLRGDDLDEESLKLLRVQHSIDTEDAAQKMLANFGRIAAETLPIVLCFDQLDNIARTSEGAIDLQSLFSVNTVIHTQKLKNFLVMISIITDTWRQNAFRVQATDKDRIDAFIQLKQINLYQGEALWASRLCLLHRKSATQPPSNLYPLDREILAEKFPGGKTRPRNVLMLGRQLFQEWKVAQMRDTLEYIDVEYREVTTPAQVPETGKEDGVASLEAAEVSHFERTLAAFKLVWLHKFNQTQERVSRIRQFSSPELMAMLAEVLEALEMQAVQLRLFAGSPTYASYSLTYQVPGEGETIGVAWSEDVNLTKFCNFMKLCQEAIASEQCHTLHLIRQEGVGTPNNLGYKIYSDIYRDSRHRHIKPDLESVCYLATYHALVNDAYAGDLIVGDRTPDITELQTAIRESQILHSCFLLQELGVVPSLPISEATKELWAPVEDFLLNRAIDQQCMARQRLLQEALSQFSHINESQVNHLLEHLCETNHRMAILNPEADLSDQLVYAVNYQGKR